MEKFCFLLGGRLEEGLHGRFLLLAFAFFFCSNQGSRVGYEGCG